MNAHKASLINAIALVALGAWGYFGSETPSPTALIPVVIGAVLLILNKGVKAENKVLAHIAVVLTALILFGLIKPLTGAMDRGDTMAMVRVGVMLATTVYALFYFIKSFRDARKARQS
ncbi:MAG: hypothetical protein D6714_13650 [Bacteroidetes bacterium]|nr:MAG: hypothetical protein D6714_13650 [Bacteroidota bacterium]